MNPQSSSNRMTFSADPLKWVLDSLVAGLSLLINVPAPEKITELIRYMVSHLRFPDGTTVTYRGTKEVLAKPLQAVTGMIWVQIVLMILIENALLQAVVMAGVAFGMAYVTYPVLRIIVANLTTNRGSQLGFAGKLEDYVKWQMFIAGVNVAVAVVSSLLPDVGFLNILTSLAMLVLSFAASAFVMVGYYAWVVSQVSGGSRVMRGQWHPVEYMMRLLLTALGCFLILTIPFMVMWWTNWVLGQIEIPPAQTQAARGYAV